MHPNDHFLELFIVGIAEEMGMHVSEIEMKMSSLLQHIHNRTHTGGDRVHRGNTVVFTQAG